MATFALMAPAKAGATDNRSGSGGKRRRGRRRNRGRRGNT